MKINLREFNGYRGTSKDRVKYLIERAKWDFSTGSDEYFGHGIYFFEEDPKEAYCFARYNRLIHESEVCVLEVKLVIEKEKVFDLLLSDVHQQYLKLIEYLKLQYKNSDKKPIIKKPFDCDLINFLCDSEGFLLVRGPYSPNNKLFKKLNYDGYTRIPKVHIQLCARSDIIINSVQVYLNRGKGISLEGKANEYI